jgi:hypothetical protein
VTDQPPFILTEREDGVRELRAFSDDSDLPIVLALIDEDGRTFGLAVADVLTALDAGLDPAPIQLTINGRTAAIEGTADNGLRLTVRT